MFLEKERNHERDLQKQGDAFVSQVRETIGRIQMFTTSKMDGMHLEFTNWNIQFFFVLDFFGKTTYTLRVRNKTTYMLRVRNNQSECRDEHEHFGAFF